MTAPPRSLAIVAAPLTRAAFAPYGDVIEKPGAAHFTINQGQAERFHDLARIDVTAAAGRPVVSIVAAKSAPRPLTLRLMERHPISSQVFMPLEPAPLVVVVAPAGPAPRPRDIRAFLTDGRQGINYAPGTWHHPLLALTDAEFLVIDRTGPGTRFNQDYDEVSYPGVAITIRVP